MDDRRRKTELLTKIAGAVAVFVVCAALIVMGTRGIRHRNELARQATSREAAAIDPALIHYREVKGIETGMKDARGIAVASDGRLYAAGDHAIICFDTDGERQEEWAMDSPPQCLAVAGDGTVVVGSRKSITIFTKELASWTVLGEKAYVTSLAIAGNDIWVADAGRRIVYHYNRKGKLLGRIGKKDVKRGIPGLLAPSPHLDVAVAIDGNLWVANPGRHQLEQYDRDGRLLSAWGKAGMEIEGFGGCCNPADFALLPDGRIVTAEKGLRRVKVYRADGTFDGVVAGPDVFSTGNGALDLAADGQGQIYVLDRVDGTVHILERGLPIRTN